MLCNFLKMFVKFRIYRCHPVYHMERSRHAVKRKALANETFAEIALLVTQKTNGSAYCLSLRGGRGGGVTSRNSFLTKTTVRCGLL